MSNEEERFGLVEGRRRKGWQTTLLQDTFRHLCTCKIHIAVQTAPMKLFFKLTLLLNILERKSTQFCLGTKQVIDASDLFLLIRILVQNKLTSSLREEGEGILYTIRYFIRFYMCEICKTTRHDQ